LLYRLNLSTVVDSAQKKSEMDRLEYLEKLVKDMSCKIADLETAQHSLIDKPVEKVAALVGRVLQSSFDSGKYLFRSLPRVICFRGYCMGFGFM
jgi:hypothetical protein